MSISAARFAGGAIWEPTFGFAGEYEFITSFGKIVSVRAPTDAEQASAPPDLTRRACRFLGSWVAVPGAAAGDDPTMTTAPVAFGQAFTATRDGESLTVVSVSTTGFESTEVFSLRIDIVGAAPDEELLPPAT